ncbi:MAG: CvpA family protein [Clostridia bacterium]|nr:CvpA family protein [Clostridia bacterium]
MLNLISADLSKGMIADVICLAIIALFAISNLSKGFFKQLFVVICAISATLLAYFFCDNLVNYANAKFGLGELVTGKIMNFFGEKLPIVTEFTDTTIKDAIKNLGLPQFIADFAIKSLETTDLINFEHVGEYLANIIANYVLTGVAFVVIFYVSKLVLFIVRKIVEKLVKLPILRGIDKILGLILGLIKAFAVLYVGIYLITIIPSSALQGAREALNDSMIGHFLQEKNLFASIITWAVSAIKF